RVAGRYALLEAGGALGKGVGPLLVARPGAARFEPSTMTVAIPGRDTTAHLLFSLAFPDAARKRFVRFSGIEAAVASGEVDAGVIIHESRFTYAAHGLVKIADLGDWWEKETGLPVPLAVICARADLAADTVAAAERAIRASVAHAFADRDASRPFVRAHAQELSDAVCDQHIAVTIVVGIAKINKPEYEYNANTALVNLTSVCCIKEDHIPAEILLRDIKGSHKNINSQ
ncbi:MAG: hypothetical protein HGA22_10105, partial [Clostridiales bacterium]|nr:hypothetical protein [Clostridiales bacterium]